MFIAEPEGVLLEYLKQLGRGDLKNIVLDDSVVADQCDHVRSQKGDKEPFPQERAIAREAVIKYYVPDPEGLKSNLSPIERAQAVHAQDASSSLREIVKTHIPALLGSASELCGHVAKVSQDVADTQKAMRNQLSVISVAEKIDADRRADMISRQLTDFAGKLVHIGIGILILLAIITGFTIRSHAQIRVIRGEESGVYKGRVAGEVTTLDFHGCTVVPAGSKFTITCTGVGDNLGTATYADVVGLWTACGTNYLRGDGTCDIPAAGSVAWGAITGTLSDQLDLQAALDGKLSTGGNAATATALAANGANCSAGNAPLGVDASGAVEGCFDVATQTELDTHTNGTSVHSATNLNTASRIVLRDGSGDFAAGTITAALTGNASTATALAADPADCAADRYATTIAASGALTCAQVTNAGLAGSIAASKLVGTDIATVGTVTSGTWSATAIGPTKGGTGQSTTATSGRYLKGDGANWGTSSGSASGTGACTNQFVRTLNSDAAPTCASVAAADITSGVVSSTQLATANKTIMKCFTLFDPVTGDSGRIQFMFPQAVTTTRVTCSVKAATSVTINLDKRAETTPDTTGTNILSSGLVCDTNAQTSCAASCDVNTINSAGISTRAPVALTISAVSGTPDTLRLCWEGTID